MKALFIVDVQNDFCPGGALPVPEGDQVVPVINRLMDHFPFVLASKDWHPSETVHFQKWPPHCVQGTPGAEFHPALRTDRIDQVFLKGTGNRDDGYSAFEATNENLAEYLRRHGVEELYVTGLATDYCVRATVLDALREGFRTYVVTDAVRAVNVSPGDGERALEEMRRAGAILVTSEELLSAQEAPQGALA
jgi:nicotinamidase/pyrazinamidase